MFPGTLCPQPALKAVETQAGELPGATRSGGMPPPLETPDALPTWDSGGAHVASEAHTRRAWVTFGSALTCEKNTHLGRWRPTTRAETAPRVHSELPWLTRTAHRGPEFLPTHSVSLKNTLTCRNTHVNAMLECCVHT